jgi:hypothetical protein
MHLASHQTRPHRISISFYFILSFFGIICCLFFPLSPTLCNICQSVRLHVHPRPDGYFLHLSHPPLCSTSLFDPCVNCVCVLPKVSLPILPLTPPDKRVTCISMLYFYACIRTYLVLLTLRPVCQLCVCAAQAHPPSCTRLVYSFRIQPLRVQPSYSGFGSVPSSPTLNQHRHVPFVTIATPTGFLITHHVCTQFQCQ